MSAEHDAPETFPGISYYTPNVSESASMTLLGMTDDEMKAAAKREKKRAKQGFGFSRAPQEKPKRRGKR